MPESDIFTSVRAALETTRGTALNPTRIIEFTDWDQTPDIKLIRPRERRGNYAAYYRAAAGRERHTARLNGNASYNQLAWLGNLFFKGVTTGTGAGADKTYTFLPTGTADDLKSATLEWGYDAALSATQPGFRLPYVVGDTLELTFDKTADEGVSFAADVHSPKGISQLTSFGGSPATISSTPIVPTQTQVYIDASGGTIGTTADNYVQRAVFSLAHTWTDLDTLNLTTAAQDTFRVGARDWTLTLLRYYINDNELDRYVDKAVRKIRIKSTGPTLGSSNYSATLDCYGVLDSDGYKIGYQDGLAFETLKYVPVYDTTSTSDHSLVVVTAETTIT